MKKKVLSMFLASAMALSIVACGSSNGGTTETQTGSSDTTASQETASETTAATTEEAQGSSELVDGKFPETRSITVEVYDRGNDGGSDPENNMYTEYIKKGMLEEHNVEVTFKKVGRWTETEDINNLLASQEAHDICVTYSYPTVLTYANMGGVIDLQDLVEQYKADTLKSMELSETDIPLLRIVEGKLGFAQLALCFGGGALALLSLVIFIISLVSASKARKRSQLY